MGPLPSDPQAGLRRRRWIRARRRLRAGPDVRHGRGLRDGPVRSARGEDWDHSGGRRHATLGPKRGKGPRHGSGAHRGSGARRRCRADGAGQSRRSRRHAAGRGQAPGADDRHPPAARRSPREGGGQPRDGSRPCAGSRVRAEALLSLVCLGGQTRGHARLPREAPGPLQRTMSDVVLGSRENAVLTLTLNRPEALNALNREATQALRMELEAAGRDPLVGAIVLTGAGRAFCAGADLKEVKARVEAGDTDLGSDLRTNYTPMIRAIRACPKPVIAALNGTAAGAGLSLALACDLRLAAAGAQLIVVFVRVGLVPDAGSLFFLTRMLGLSKATELAITGDPVSADEALRLGIVVSVVPPEQLMPAAMERARQLAAGPRQTYALIKRGLDRALHLDLEQTLELESQLQALAAETPDAQEAIRAFLEKRKPDFKR